MTAQQVKWRHVKPGVYEHYKGGLYRVLCSGQHTETDEAVVVYEAVKDGRVWVRPVEVFTGHVSAMGVQYRRFKPVDLHNLFFFDEHMFRPAAPRSRRRARLGAAALA